MQNEIDTFLAAGREFFASYQIETIELERFEGLPKFMTPDAAELLAAGRRTNRARNSLVAAGRELATRLEAAGKNSTDLLTFVRAVDGLGHGLASGGPSKAWPLWGPLAVSLERLAIQQGLPPVATSAPGKKQGEGDGTGTQADRPPAPGDAGKQLGDEPNRYDVLKTLEPKEYKAWLSFQYAETKAGRRLQDRDAWDWLTENGTTCAGSGELAGYELPAFDTWARYLRIARNAVGEQKHRRRAPPAPGRSVVRGDNLERQKPDDE